MSLNPGRRLDNGGQAAYEIVANGWNNGRHVYDRGRKILWNFRYPAESLDEAGPDEAFDVLVRSPLVTGTLPGAGDVGFEIERVFALPGAAWFLEPLDVLDPPEGEAAGPVRGPLLVLADPHALPLETGSPLGGQRREGLVRMATELLAMLEFLHESRLAANGFNPGDFLVDGTGRWFYLGTDRVGTVGSDVAIRDDLEHWARLVVSVLTPTGRVEELAAALQGHEGPLVRWVDRCLVDDPSRRPLSVADLREGGASRRGLFGFWTRH